MAQVSIAIVTSNILKHSECMFSGKQNILLFCWLDGRESYEHVCIVQNQGTGDCIHTIAHSLSSRSSPPTSGPTQCTNPTVHLQLLLLHESQLPTHPVNFFSHFAQVVSSVTTNALLKLSMDSLLTCAIKIAPGEVNCTCYTYVYTAIRTVNNQQDRTVTFSTSSGIEGYVGKSCGKLHRDTVCQVTC